MAARHYLLVRSKQCDNVYGPFTAEVLRSEGLMGFETVDLDTSGLPELGSDDIVILTRCFLRTSEIDFLHEAVEAGARLVCLHPSPRMLDRLGWVSTGAVLQEGWIGINEGYPGAGDRIQTHVPIPLFAPGLGAHDVSVIAEALSAEWEPSGAVAVASQVLGEGRVTLFLYDLPKAVARIRFGNPDLASVATTGQWDWVHSFDMFVGHAEDRVGHLPQADFHCQLLAKVLTQICPYPLARIWYYPDCQHRSAAVFQSDDDMSSPEHFAELAGVLEAHGATGTFYLMEQTLLPDEQVADMRRRGHTFGPHVTAHPDSEEWYFTFPEQLARQTEVFRERYGQVSTTLQSHCAPWYGYMEWVPAHVANGYRLLFAYTSNPLTHLNRYMCGSGRPMRLFDTNGTLYDCWQQPLVTMDDLSVKDIITNHAEQLIGDFEQMLGHALERAHTAVAMLSHPVSFSTYSRAFMEPALDLLVQNNVPIYNGDQWRQFQDMRSAVQIWQEITADSECRCTVSGAAGKVSLMLPPKQAGSAEFSVLVDGRPVEGVLQRCLEEYYLFVPLEGRPDGAEIDVLAQGL